MYFGLGGLSGVNPCFFRKQYAFITLLYKFDPEYNKTGVRIPVPHISNQFDFIKSMWVGIGMRTPKAVMEEVPRAIIGVF